MRYGGDLKTGPVRLKAELVGHVGGHAKAAPVGPGRIVRVRLEERRRLPLYAAVDADHDGPIRSQSSPKPVYSPERKIE